MFQVAVYAEFRRDWVEVLKFYEAAYSLLQEVTFCVTLLILDMIVCRMVIPTTYVM